MWTDICTWTHTCEIRCVLGGNLLGGEVWSTVTFKCMDSSCVKFDVRACEASRIEVFGH